MHCTHPLLGQYVTRHRAAIPLALVAVLLAVTLAGCGSSASASGSSSNRVPSVLVQTTQVREGYLPRVVRAYGSVQANPADRHAVTVTLPATVETVYVRDGQMVSKGAPLLGLAPTPQSESSYAQAVSALRVASDLVKRTEELLHEHLATRQQLSAAQKGRNDARAALKALRAQGAAGSTVIRAPFSGIVTALSTSAHAIATVGSALLELVRPDALVLNVGVGPNVAVQINPGDAAKVRAIGARRTFTGTVQMRGDVVNVTTGLVPVQISLPPATLLPGQWAQAEITVGKVHGYVVPHAAILVDNKGETYVVQVQQGLAKIVPVRILNTLGPQDTVSGALDERAPLVLSGNHQLSDGMRIRLADSSSHGAKR